MNYSFNIRKNKNHSSALSSIERAQASTSKWALDDFVPCSEVRQTQGQRRSRGKIHPMLFLFLFFLLSFLLSENLPEGAGYGLNLKCSLKRPMIKAWLPSCRVIGRWLSLQEVGPSRRKLGHSGHVLEGYIWDPGAFSSLCFQVTLRQTGFLCRVHLP